MRTHLRTHFDSKKATEMETGNQKLIPFSTIKNFGYYTEEAGDFSKKKNIFFSDSNRNLKYEFFFLPFLSEEIRKRISELFLDDPFFYNTSILRVNFLYASFFNGS